MSKTARMVLVVVLIVVILSAVGFVIYRQMHQDAPVVPKTLPAAPTPAYAGGGGGAAPTATAPSVAKASLETTKLVFGSDVEGRLYEAYKASYLQADGSVISNVQSVSWCPNSCIGCGSDVTSEGIARFARVAVFVGDKPALDKVNAYAKTVMKSRTGFLQWKMTNGQAGSCGGANSAVDGELIMIGALLDAENKWGNNGYGADARALMASMKTGLINGTYLPNCMYDQSGHAEACEPTVFLGYINLPVLKEMCSIDGFWCNVHQANKALLIQAVQGNGTYSTYYMNQDRWAWENADIHPGWVLLHLAQDGDQDAWLTVQPFYDKERPLVLAGGQICQEFNPASGCKMANPPLRVYANWLEIAHARGDAQFENVLRSYITSKIPTLPTSPLADVDNYGNVVILEALSSTR